LCGGRANQSCWERREEANVGWAGQVRAVDVVISNQGRGIIPLMLVLGDGRMNRRRSERWIRRAF